MKVSFLLSFTLIAAGCTTSDRTAEDVAAVVAGRAGDGAAGEIQRARKDDRRIREAYDLGVLQATKSLHAAIHATQQTDLAERSSPDQTLVPEE